MTLPAAGWFPDPRDGTRLRWWDGTTWGGETRPLPRRPQPVVAPVVQAAPAGPAFSVRAATGATETRTWAYGSCVRRFCLFAFVAVLLAIVSVFENPFGVGSLLALASGIVGIVRPRGTGGWRLLGRSLSASAIVLAVATGIVAANEALHLF